MQKETRPKGLEKIRALPDKKKLETLAVFAAIALLVLLVWPTLFGSPQADTAENKNSGSQAFDAQSEEDDLVRVLSSIRGAGDVQVMITYESEPVLEPAYESSYSTSNTQEDSRTTSNETETKRPSSSQSDGLVLTQKRPEVRGVVVIAQGASDIQVKMELAQAVQTALGVSASKVDVFEMKP